jgi:hypothetical protein
MKSRMPTAQRPAITGIGIEKAVTLDALLQEPITVKLATVATAQQPRVLMLILHPIPFPWSMAERIRKTKSPRRIQGSSGARTGT